MNIKHICVAFSGMALLACTSEALEDAKLSNELLNVEKELEMTAVETERAVAVSADCRWEVTVDKQEWSELTVQPLSGNGNGTIMLKTGTNTSISERTAQLTITSAGGLRQKVTIRQTLGGATLTVNRAAMTFDAVPTASQSFTVSSNAAWSILGIDDNWLTVEPASGSGGTTEVKVTAAEIQDDRSREMMLTVALDNGTERHDIQVTQAGKTNISLAVTPTALDFNGVGGEVSLAITCNSGWTTRMATIDNPWLTLSASEGVGNGELTVSCLPNYTTASRYFPIYVTSGTMDPKLVEIVVNQSAGALPVITSPLAMVDNTLGSTGASFTFGYESMFPLTDYGICYSTTNATPTVDDTCISSGEGPTANPTVTVAMTDLTPYTKYYVRAYVKSPMNNGEVCYSAALDFQTTGMEPSGDDNPYPKLGRAKK